MLEDFRNKFHLGDSLELMKQIPDESVDLIVTSPPYNIRTTSRHKSSAPIPRMDREFYEKGYKNHDDAMPHEEYVLWQRCCLWEMFRVIKPAGAVFYNHKWRQQGGLLQDRADIMESYPVRQIIIWDRGGGPMCYAKTFFMPSYEVIYLIPKPEWKLVPKGALAGDVWRFHHAQGNPHPAPFPEDLPVKCILACTTVPNGEYTVLDPFMGSGTTAIAAERLGVGWIGIDNSSEYVEMAQRRLAVYRAQLKFEFPRLLDPMNDLPGALPADRNIGNPGVGKDDL